jgi:LacI family transcriptional regulator
MTIYDIAREAGVSGSTVSRVVNGKPGVKKDKRDKILQLLEKYHYTPDVGARGLVTQSSRIVGILVAEIRNLHYAEGAYYIERQLEQKGYCCLILNTGESEESRVRALHTLEQRRVEGVVLIGSIFQSREIEHTISLCLSDVPVVMINGHLPLHNVYSVLADEENGIRDCVEYLVKRGRRHLVFLVDSPTPSSRLKEKGFVRGCEAHADRVQYWIYRGVATTPDAGAAAARCALKEHPECDGFVCSVDLLAAGAARALREAGRAVPGDISVIGVDNSVYCTVSTPQLTSLDNKLIESCVAAGRTLVDVLEGHRPSRRTTLASEIVLREST